jgi:predicted GH43/DUF377 family glycosyl hydrolase
VRLEAAAVRRTDHQLRPDPTRVVTALFLPGQELAAPGRSRSTGVLERVVGLSDAQVDVELEALTTAFAHRHRDLAATWTAHAELVAHRLDPARPMSAARRHLVGAYFTQEYAIEGAALTNPSMTRHPDQSGLAEGSTRFVLTLRAVGEGHLSSVELRTGTVDAQDVVVLDPPPTVAVLPSATAVSYSRAAFEHQLAAAGPGEDGADAGVVLDALGPAFSRGDLDAALAGLRAQRLTRGSSVRTAEHVERIAADTYAVQFPADSAVQERVLMPRAPSESRGMEDVRLTQLALLDGGTELAGTYTAYDGHGVRIHLLRTTDLRTYAMAPLSGPGARDKGLALFPRPVGGRYCALSRSDRESNGITTSADLLHWEAARIVQSPERPWEIVQLGNCGPPLETEAGWLVLTHGVGPMRTYAIGALLLDLEDPTVVVGRLDEPLLVPTEDERHGYVPNVVYSCGAMLHGRTVVLPYGCSDLMTRIALVDLDAVLDALTGPARRGAREIRPAATA